MTDAPGMAEMLDVQFALQGEQVPADHAEDLWQAVRVLLPWFDEDARSGVHPLGGLSPGVPMRYLSRRARLTLRVPRMRAEAAERLCGHSVTIGGQSLALGRATRRELGVAPVLHAKCVSYFCPGDVAGGDEGAFFAACEAELRTLGMQPRLVCGKLKQFDTPQGKLEGFSLLVAGLTLPETLRLQELGLGLERRRGCGIFIPHKSMAAVGQIE